AVLDSRTVDWSAEPGTPGDGAQPPPAPAPVQPGEPVRRVRTLTLTTRPSIPRASRWTVRIRPSPIGDTDNPATQDMIESNNSAPISVDLVDRPIRVAFFDGYPRWEYRYLKNLLVRERSISSVVMLLAPGKRYVQEGTTVLDSLPQSPEEWSKFD